MAVPPQKILALLEKKFSGADIHLTDSRGDQNHYEVSIQSDLFNGKSRVQQHQMVYEALKELLIQDLHALSLRTGPTLQ